MRYWLIKILFPKKELKFVTNCLFDAMKEARTKGQKEKEEMANKLLIKIN